MDGSAQSPLVSGGVAAVKVELPICCQLIQCKQKEGEIVFQPLPLLDHVDQKTTAAVKPSRGRGRPPRSSKPSIPSSPGRKRSTPPMRMMTRSAAGLHAPSVGGGTNHVPSGRVVTVVCQRSIAPQPAGMLQYPLGVQQKGSERRKLTRIAPRPSGGRNGQELTKAVGSAIKDAMSGVNLEVVNQPINIQLPESFWKNNLTMPPPRGKSATQVAPENPPFEAPPEGISADAAYCLSDYNPQSSLFYNCDNSDSGFGLSEYNPPNLIHQNGEASAYPENVPSHFACLENHPQNGMMQNFEPANYQHINNNFNNFFNSGDQNDQQYAFNHLQPRQDDCEPHHEPPHMLIDSLMDGYMSDASGFLSRLSQI